MIKTQIQDHSVTQIVNKMNKGEKIDLYQEICTKKENENAKVPPWNFSKGMNQSVKRYTALSQSRVSNCFCAMNRDKVYIMEADS